MLSAQMVARQKCIKSFSLHVLLIKLSSKVNDIMVIKVFPDKNYKPQASAGIANSSHI